MGGHCRPSGTTVKRVFSPEKKKRVTNAKGKGMPSKKTRRT